MLLPPDPITIRFYQKQQKTAFTHIVYLTLVKTHIHIHCSALQHKLKFCSCTNILLF